MKYRNTKTGAVILTHCKLTGGNWQLLEPAAPAEIEDTAEDADTAETEDTSENAQPPKSDRPQTGAKPAVPAAKKPAAKSAAGRKGK